MIMLLCFNVSVFLSFIDLYTFQTCLCSVHLFCLETLKKMINSSFQVSMMEKDNYIGRILTGRISTGILRVGDKVHGIRSSDSGVVKIEEGKVCALVF